jgi:hypothetical protein
MTGASPTRRGRRRGWSCKLVAQAVGGVGIGVARGRDLQDLHAVFDRGERLGEPYPPLEQTQRKGDHEGQAPPPASPPAARILRLSSEGSSGSEGGDISTV